MVVDGSRAKHRGWHHGVPWQARLAVFLFVNWVAWAYRVLVPVFCASSLLFVCLFGFRNKEEAWPGQEGELSAYSVFNNDFKELPGTLNAAGIDRQLRHGPTPASSSSSSQAKAGGGGHWANLGKGHKLS